MAITFKEIKAKRAIVRQIKADLDASRERWRKLNYEAIAEKTKGTQLNATYEIEIKELRDMGAKFALDEGEEDVTPALPGIVDAVEAVEDDGRPAHWTVIAVNYEESCSCGKMKDTEGNIDIWEPCLFHDTRNRFYDRKSKTFYNTTC